MTEMKNKGVDCDSCAVSPPTTEEIASIYNSKSSDLRNLQIQGRGPDLYYRMDILDTLMEDNPPNSSNMSSYLYGNHEYTMAGTSTNATNAFRMTTLMLAPGDFVFNHTITD